MEKPLPPTGPGDAGMMEENINLHHYWHVILERRWLVISAFISVFVCCLIYLAKAPRIYQSVATLEINSESENVLNIRDAFSVDGRAQDYLQTQYKNLRSPKLIRTVITKCNLDNDPRYVKKIDRVKAVLDDIAIVPIRLSRLVEIRASHTVPKKAQEIADTLINTFVDNNLDERKKDSYRAIDNLRTESSAQQGKLIKAEELLQAFKAEKNMVSFEGGKNIVFEELKLAQEEHTKALAKAAAAEKLDEEVQQLLRTNSAALATLPQVVNDKYVQELKAKLDVEEAELAGLKQRYKERFPLVKVKLDTIKSLNESLAMAATNIIQSISHEAVFAKAEAEKLKELVKSLEDMELKLDKDSVQYGALARDADLQRSLSLQVDKSLKDLEISVNSKINNMRVRDPADLPLRTIKPRIVLTLFLGTIGGIIVACGLAFFVNYLDDSIKTQDDVEIYLRMPFLGYVPNIKSNSVIERDLQAHLHPQSTAAEGFRTIRAAVSLMPNADKHRTLVVTSTIPSEGKSLLTSNLAIVTAQTGVKTLLVDVDLRRPSVHKAFQLHSPIGLSAYLNETVSSMDEIVHTTEVPHLDVVCAGAIPSNPSELSGSKRMRQFLAEALKRYDRIFLDCPPVSAVSDPLIIAAMSDGVVFVTKFNKIRREHARKSIQRIQDAGIRVLGIVLNDIDFEGKDSYYYSYYYYQNRYYASHYRTGGKDGKDDSKPSNDKPVEKSEA